MTDQDIKRAQALIPSFLKNLLSADDSVWMTQFLSQLQSSDPALAQAFTEEMQWVQKTQQHMESTLPHMDINAGWAHLAQQVSQSPSAQAAARTPTPSQVRSQNESFFELTIRWMKIQALRLLGLWRKPVVAVLGSAMIVGQMGLLAAVIKQLHHVENSAHVIPASGSKAALPENSVMVQVVFKDNTSVADIRKLLDLSGAQIIGGPSALGVWEVQIEKAKQTAAIEQISKSKAVESISLP
jgi:hypothetical protein